MMPAFMRFYPGMTPATFRGLTVADFRALNDYRLATLRAQEHPDG